MILLFWKQGQAISTLNGADGTFLLMISLSVAYWIPAAVASFTHTPPSVTVSVYQRYRHFTHTPFNQGLQKNGRTSGKYLPLAFDNDIDVKNLL